MAAKRVTIKDVASRAGVSIATVSHVLNGTKFVSEEMQSRVNESVKELDYRPSSVASSLRRQRSQVLGLVLPMRDQDSSAIFFTQLAAGIEEVASRHGYRSVISNSVEDSAREHAQLGMLRSQFTDFIDGLVLAQAAGSQEDEEEISTSVPVLYVDRIPGDTTGKDYVVTDNYRATTAALDRLFELEVQDVVGIFSPIDVSSMLERHGAFVAALQRRGIDTDRRVFEIPSSNEEGYEITKSILRERPNIDALFVANNTVAMGVVRALRETLGQRASNVSLVVYDEFEWLDISELPILAIEQPAYEMGREAAKALLDRIADPSLPPSQRIVPSRLVEHGGFGKGGVVSNHR